MMTVLLFRIFVIVLCAVIGTAIVVYFINALIMPFKKAKALQAAMDAGRVIEAKRYDYKYPTGVDNIMENYIWGYYSYTYGNKIRKFRLRFITIPPETLTLYYKKNPAKAHTEISFGYMESGFGLIFLIMLSICGFFSMFM